MDTVWAVVNHDRDKEDEGTAHFLSSIQIQIELNLNLNLGSIVKLNLSQFKVLNKKALKAFKHAQGKDVIIWGPCCRLGGPFQSQWQVTIRLDERGFIRIFY